jgi:hypothetical protein
MKKLFLLGVVFSLPAQALFIWGPDGAADVQETSYGYAISSLSGKGITTINKTSNGYVVIPPNEPATFIQMSPEEMRKTDDVGEDVW